MGEWIKGLKMYINCTQKKQQASNARSHMDIEY